MITVQFPSGVNSFVDSHGNHVTPDANGQASVDPACLGDYLEAGFVPAALVSEFLVDEALVALMGQAMSGDLVFVVSPATVSTPATAAAWTRTVTISLKTAAGDVHTWFNAAIATGVSIGDTSTAGTATIPATTLTFVAGVATVVVSGGTAAWLAAETDTLTVVQATILGYTVAAVTSVETFA